MTFTVLVNAGPWLPVPPHGYGGIENVIATLVPELRRLGVRVVLATVGTSGLPVDERITVFPDGQFATLQRPYNQVMGLAQAHLHEAPDGTVTLVALLETVDNDGMHAGPNRRFMAVTRRLPRK